jgi:hypothetical protein
MAFSFFLYLYRYFLFAITLISNAIICSAAAWNLPIAKNTNLHTQQQVDIYMIFLGALSLVFVIPMVFADVFFPRAIAGRVWVECLWVDFLWLLHLIGVIFVTAFLPHDMCTPEAKFINGDSCTSAKVILAFSWICTTNLSIYLFTLLVSAMLHYRQDCTVWSSQVRSYPWYANCHKLESRPSTPLPRHPRQPPISAPQPRRPIRLPTRSMLSYLHKAEIMHVPALDPEDPPPVRRASQRATMGQAAASSAQLTVLYPLHVQAVWGTSAAGPSSGGGGGDNPAFSPTSARPHRTAPAPSTATLPPNGSPPPLWNWPRADIMTQPPPVRKKAVAVPSAPRPPPARPIDPPPPQRSRGRGYSAARSRPVLTPASPV